MDKRVKLLLLSIGIALLVAIISTSYAYFTISNKTGSEETITSGTMSLSLNDGSKIETNFMIPGEYIEKTFYVTNTGNLATSYDIYLSEVINDFADKTDLVYTLTSNDGGYNTSGQVQAPSQSAKIVDNQSIGTSTTHHYTLRITFLNKNEAQDDNQGKHFSGKIQINEYQEADNGGNGGNGGNTVQKPDHACPGVECKYAVGLGSNYINGDPLTSEYLNDLYTDYNDAFNQTDKEFIYAVWVNPITDVIESGFVCDLYNNNIYCVEGGDNGLNYNYNKENVLLPLFGAYDSSTGNGCIASNNGNTYTCTYGLDKVEIRSDGRSSMIHRLYDGQYDIWVDEEYGYFFYIRTYDEI